ncbi:unnamed protein product [Toxocara canis]|uniref:Secreted protein n=1 Tax=Toxocara canis TaxID=6265 RepID=A0A183U474_TOXCA|nr:unnamed protein product [Toxocara canis]
MRAIYVLYILTALDFVSATLSPYAHKYFDDSSHRSHRFHRRRSAQHGALKSGEEASATPFWFVGVQKTRAAQDGRTCI